MERSPANARESPLGIGANSVRNIHLHGDEDAPRPTRILQNSGVPMASQSRYGSIRTTCAAPDAIEIVVRPGREAGNRRSASRDRKSEHRDSAMRDLPDGATSAVPAATRMDGA